MQVVAERKAKKSIHAPCKETEPVTRGRPFVRSGSIRIKHRDEFWSFTTSRHTDEPIKVTIKYVVEYAECAV